MIIHIYALCWNEEKMLPYFFRHYDKIADQYYIFDNNSADNSYSILKSHPKVVANKINLPGQSMVEAAQQQYNSIWKKSRGKADWVIVCNMDEHFYHPNLRDYLERCTSVGITLVIPTAYEMVSDVFPVSDKPLCETVKYGARDYTMDKPEIFNPNEIQEINFIPGRHWASPVGNVKKPPIREVLLLHYKYLGVDYVNKRHLELKTGLRQTDIVSGYGIQYLMNEEVRRKKISKLKEQSIKVI